MAMSETRIHHQRVVVRLPVSEEKSLSESARITGWKSHGLGQRVHLRRWQSKGNSRICAIRAIFLPLVYSQGNHVEPGSESTSLISTLPGAAGAGTREPATGGGIGEAHP